VWVTVGVALPSATKTGYNFKGWYDGNGQLMGNAGDLFGSDQNMTLYAHWEPKKITVTYNRNF
jgi:uncharacterized repeat protein (TIGR02543 family)